MGISSIMLSALIAIYVGSKSVVEHGGEFSNYVTLLAGIKQGGPPSGVLYIAYTLGIIDLYNNQFNLEPLIASIHLLMHADDILMLATSKLLAVDKLRSLITYCKNNYIRLQLTKCAFMCVNSKDPHDHEPIIIDDLTLNNTSRGGTPLYCLIGMCRRYGRVFQRKNP